MSVITSTPRIGLDAIGPLDGLTEGAPELVTEAIEPLPTGRPVVTNLSEGDEPLGGR
jgi:hypothetical protein